MKMEHLIEWHVNNKRLSTLKKFFGFLHMYEDPHTRHGFSTDVYGDLLGICAIGRHGVDIFALFTCLFNESNKHTWDALVAAIMYENMRDQCVKQYDLYDNMVDNIDWHDVFKNRDSLTGQRNAFRIHSMLLQFTHTVAPFLSLNYNPKIEFMSQNMDDFQLHGGRYWQGLFVLPNPHFLTDFQKVCLFFFCILFYFFFVVFFVFFFGGGGGGGGGL